MNKLKTTKYMNIFTNIGYVLGFGLIVWYIITQDNGLLPIMGVIVIFLGPGLLHFNMSKIQIMLIIALFFCQIFVSFMLYGVVLYDIIPLGGPFYET